MAMPMAVTTSLLHPCSHSPRSHTNSCLPNGHPIPPMFAAVGTYASYVKATTCL